MPSISCFSSACPGHQQCFTQQVLPEVSAPESPHCTYTPPRKAPASSQLTSLPGRGLGLEGEAQPGLKVQGCSCPDFTERACCHLALLTSGPKASPLLPWSLGPGPDASPSHYPEMPLALTGYHPEAILKLIHLIPLPSWTSQGPRGAFDQESMSHIGPLHYGKVTLETSGQAQGMHAEMGKDRFPSSPGDPERKEETPLPGVRIPSAASPA